MDGSSSTAAPAEKRRRRPPLACIACRRRKVRCDRKLPCQNCVRARRATSCAYVPDERIESRDDGAPGFADGLGTGSRNPQQEDVVSASYLSPTASHNSTSNATPEQLAERVRQLEQQLNQVLDARSAKTTTTAPPEVPSANPPSSFLGPEHWQVGSLGTPGHGIQPQIRSSKKNENTEENASSAVNATAILAKSRYLGNSHWIHGVTLVSFVISPLVSPLFQECSNPMGKAHALSFHLRNIRVMFLIYQLLYHLYIKYPCHPVSCYTHCCRMHRVSPRVVHIPVIPMSSSLVS